MLHVLLVDMLHRTLLDMLHRTLLYMSLHRMLVASCTERFRYRQLPCMGFRKC